MEQRAKMAAHISGKITNLRSFEKDKLAALNIQSEQKKYINE